MIRAFPFKIFLFAVVLISQAAFSRAFKRRYDYSAREFLNRFYLTIIGSVSITIYIYEVLPDLLTISKVSNYLCSEVSRGLSL